MAVHSAEYITVLDIGRQPEAGAAGKVIEMLAQKNPILEDAPAIPCNKGSYHETYVRTGLPSPIWGAMYEGVPTTKGSKQLIKDTTGFLNSASEVDCRIIDIVEKAEKKASIRMDEAAAHIEGMSQAGASAMFYADSRVNARLPMGLSPRYSSLTAENGKNIINGGGVGNDNTSVWFITWGESTCHLIYPEGHVAGVQHENQGKHLVDDGTGKKYMAYRDEFNWHFGVCLRNWQYVTRIANIDVSDLKMDASSGADLINLFTDAYYAHAGRRDSKGKTVIYANTTIVKFLDYQARNVKDRNLFLTFDQFGPNASEILHFRGLPIRETDALLNSEEAVA